MLRLARSHSEENDSTKQAAAMSAMMTVAANRAIFNVRTSASPADGEGVGGRRGSGVCSPGCGWLCVELTAARQGDSVGGSGAMPILGERSSTAVMGHATFQSLAVSICIRIRQNDQKTPVAEWCVAGVTGHPVKTVGHSPSH